MKQNFFSKKERKKKRRKKKCYFKNSIAAFSNAWTEVSLKIINKGFKVTILCVCECRCEGRDNDGGGGCGMCRSVGVLIIWGVFGGHRV